MFQTAGSRLPVKKVVSVVARALRLGPRSRPSARLAKTFENDACNAFKLPVMVVSASTAVAPVMPISVCTTWIASIILSKPMLLTFSAVATIVSPSTPESLIRRAISACVPP